MNQEILKTQPIQLIPLIYKDVGMIKGPLESARVFKDIIEKMDIQFTDEETLKFKPIMMEVDEIKKHYKDPDFRKQLLMSFNFVQDVEARGLYPLIARKHDICFSKKPVNENIYKNEYAQAKLQSELVGMKFFPKYFYKHARSERFYNMSWEKLYYANTLPKHIKVGIYHRKSACPMQEKAYVKFKKRYPTFNYVEIGEGHQQRSSRHFIDDIDLILYACPTHPDPWPNTIFECLVSSIPVIMIHRDYQIIGNGIQELRNTFPNSFMDYHLDDNDYVRAESEYSKVFLHQKVLPGETNRFYHRNLSKGLFFRMLTVNAIAEQIQKAIRDKLDAHKDGWYSFTVGDFDGSKD